MNGIVVGFRDPQPPAIVEAESDRLLDIRLARKQGYVETIRNDHCRCGLLRWQRCIDWSVYTLCEQAAASTESREDCGQRQHSQ